MCWRQLFDVDDSFCRFRHQNPLSYNMCVGQIIHKMSGGQIAVWSRPKNLVWQKIRPIFFGLASGLAVWHLVWRSGRTEIGLNLY